MTEQATSELRIERTYDAPAQAVFDAWTNPEVMKRMHSEGWNGVLDNLARELHQPAGGRRAL